MSTQLKIFARLVSLNIVGHKQYDGGLVVPEKLEMHINSEVSPTKKSIVVTIKYDCSMSANSMKLFNLELNYEGIFTYHESLSQGAVEAFAKGNAPAIIYPFLRSVVSMATLAAGFPPINLPVVNFQKFPVTLTTVE